MPDLQFRPYTPHDIDALHQAALESRGPGFSEWMPWCHDRYTRADSEQFILTRAAQQDHALGMFDPVTGQLLGGTGINQINTLHQFGNLGYWVRRSHWGRGLAVQAIHAAARMAFQELDLWRVEILIASGNHKSIRAAEKSGAHREGTLASRLNIAGQRHDAVLYSLVRTQTPDKN